MNQAAEQTMAAQPASCMPIAQAAPAARQTSTASSTRGVSPPREFLKVATLLTFTDNLIDLPI